MGFRQVFDTRAYATVACVFALLAIASEVPGATGQSSSQSTAKPRAAIRPQSVTQAVRSSIPRTYTVCRGDTLYSIARKYSTSVKALQAANNLDDSRLKIGQRLHLTAEAGRTSRAAAAREPSRPEPEWPRITKANQFAMVRKPLDMTASDIVDAQHSDPLEPVAPEPGVTESEALTLSLARLQLIGTGFGYVGVRYRWNGTSEKTGFDCSGLVQRLFDQFGISLPRSAREQFKQGVEVAVADLELGDLLFFGGRSRIPTHVGIYVGERSILHAQSGARRVIVSDLDRTWYKRRFLGARRIAGLWEASVAAERKLSADATR